jgi:hypothetical protein
LLTVDGGEKISASELDAHSEPELDYGKIYAFASFIALSLLPVMRLLRQKDIAHASSGSERGDA